MKAYVVSTFAVAPDRLTTAGFGDTKPVGDNKTDAGRGAEPAGGAGQEVTRGCLLGAGIAMLLLARRRPPLYVLVAFQVREAGARPMTPTLVLLLASTFVLAACRGPADASHGAVTFSQTPAAGYRYAANLVLSGSTVHGTVKASHIVESAQDGEATIECDVDGHVTTVARRMRVVTVSRSTLEKTVSLPAEVSESGGKVSVALRFPRFATAVRTWS